jgi:hypothetical protein
VGRQLEALHLGGGLKVPRQCPLALLAEVYLRKGEASGTEKV